MIVLLPFPLQLIPGFDDVATVRRRMHERRDFLPLTPTRAFLLFILAIVVRVPPLPYP